MGLRSVLSTSKPVRFGAHSSPLTGMFCIIIPAGCAPISEFITL